ncbi:MAG TPA: hypothetical protein VF701_02275 [Thermoanaerobaculia bacterium]
MAIDPLWIWIAVGAVALIVVVALIARGARNSKSEQLRERFGNEYDHAVQNAGSRAKAERELEQRADEVSRYDIRPLSAKERERFQADWSRVEQHFIERPTTAVVEADETVAEIMRTRGYPMGDFEKHAAHLSVTNPTVVEHYRSGHKVMSGAPGSASTEDLRQSMLHYRALFDELISDRSSGDVPRDIPRANEVEMAAPRSDTRPRPVDVVERDRDLNRKR